jgi:hypothetical protein
MVKSLRKPLLISLATVVIVISGVIGLLAINQHTGPATEPTPEPTTSSTPSSLTGIGVYAFTAGLQYVDNPSTVISDLKSSRFQPEGIDWVVGWRVIEPSQGRYDWTTLDKDLTAARSAGYRSIVEVIPGVDDPGWALAQCPVVSVTLGGTGETASICVPTSPQFLALWTQMITAFGQHFHGQPDLTMVQATGCGVQGEMQLPNHNAAFWAGYGVNSSTLLSAWERVISAWRTALPSIPSALAIEEPLGAGNSTVLQPLLSYVREQFGAMVWVQQNGLRDGTKTSPGSYGGDLAEASQWTTVGWQMYGAGARNGNFALAVGGGLPAHPTYYEIYLSDILDASVAPTLGQLKAGTLAPS